MPQDIIDNLYLNAPRPLDAKYSKKNGILYTSFSSTSEANAATIKAYRSLGLTVLINDGGENKEFWYKDGIEDVDLVEKNSSGGSAAIMTIAGNDSFTGDGVTTEYIFSHGESGDRTPKAVILQGTTFPVGFQNIVGTYCITQNYTSSTFTVALSPAVLSAIDGYEVNFCWIAHF